MPILMEAKNHNFEDLNHIIDLKPSITTGLSSYTSFALLITATLFFAYSLISKHAFESNSLSSTLLEGSVFILLLTVLIDSFIRVARLNAAVSFYKKDTSYSQKYFINTVNQQFENWQLSDFEIKLALLLLKGMTISEIALMLGKKEFVIEKKAREIYIKANVKDRYELISYFINELITEKEFG